MKPKSAGTVEPILDPCPVSSFRKWPRQACEILSSYWMKLIKWAWITAAIPRLPALGEIDADTVMPRLLGEWAAHGPIATALAVLVFLGALAAIMSTADSVLLSLGSIVSEDLLGRSRLDPRTTLLGKRIAAGVEYGSETGRKLALLGATSLYLDFINLFLFLLRLLGRRD